VEFSGGTVAGGRIARRDDGGIALTIAPTAPPRERRSRKKPGCWKTGVRIAAAGSTGTDRRQEGRQVAPPFRSASMSRTHA